MEKARVFISCGQSNGEEKAYGVKASEWFRTNGFEPYFAEQYNTPEGLTENIFNALKKCEYFISINFEREHSQVGSLFIQQELAIASFLRIPMISFHKGKIQLQGIQKYILLNSIKINTVEELINNLKDKTKEWDSKSKNQLFLTFGNHHPNIPLMGSGWKPILDGNNKPILADWYHIIVHNQSSSINVTNCSGYIDSITNVRSGEIIFKDNDYKTELFWAAAGDIRINIPKLGKRDLDAFHFRKNDKRLLFNQRTTSSEYGYPLLDQGKYSISYIVISDNIAAAKCEIKIEISEEVKILDFQQI